MKRVAIVLAVLLVVPLVTGSASAGEKWIRRYRAETSDGQFLRFRTVRDDGSRRLDGAFFGNTFQLPCEDGTIEPRGGAGFSEWPWYFEGHSVTVDESAQGGGWSLHIEGTFGPARASGTFLYTRVFRHEGEAVVCSTGDLTWTAERFA